ncbi:polysaccharide pyruvyl transferase family protein [Lacrimispora sp.]|uniref:polysaccharide pyruvyl transferase family protein n=1 Tax=Lacrimispora sp. TaxID=2719234 RepID=UPI002FDAEFF4
MRKRYAIFGAGNYGNHALWYLSAERTVCFVDNDVSKIGNRYHGKLVVSLDEYKEYYRDAVMVIACEKYEEIALQLKKEGIKVSYIFERDRPWGNLIPWTKNGNLKAVNENTWRAHDIGLVGIYSEYSYGAEITYFALYSFLKKQGYRVLMIQHPMDSPHIPAGIPRLFNENPYDPQDLSALIDKRENMTDVNLYAETFILGSDQMWNCEISKLFNEIGLLYFIRDEKKKVAYSTSFGTEEWDGSLEDEIKYSQFLKRFDRISVRENSGIAICKKWGIDTEVNIDPVFLCDFKVYWDMANSSEKKNKGVYLASYVLYDTSEKTGLLTHIKEHLKWSEEKIAGIDAYKEGYYSVSSIEEWLCLIAESSFVFTDSFHGACMAIIFKKPFVIMRSSEADKRTTRVQSLLGRLGLSERFVSDVNEMITRNLLQNEIDYQKVHDLIEQDRIKARKWIQTALG